MLAPHTEACDALADGAAARSRRARAQDRGAHLTGVTMPEQRVNITLTPAAMERLGVSKPEATGVPRQRPAGLFVYDVEIDGVYVGRTIAVNRDDGAIIKES